MSAMASQITCLKIVYPSVYSGADQRKHQSSASLAFVRGIHRRPVNSPHEWPVTRKMFPFDDVIMSTTLENFWYLLTNLCGCRISGDRDKCASGHSDCHTTDSRVSIMGHVLRNLWSRHNKSDAIWRHRSGSQLAQVMASCLTAPTR